MVFVSDQEGAAGRSFSRITCMTKFVDRSIHFELSFEEPSACFGQVQWFAQHLAVLSCVRRLGHGFAGWPVKSQGSLYK